MIRCRILGHRYGELQRGDPDWIVYRGCERCRGAIRPEVDRERFHGGWAKVVVVKDDGTELTFELP